MIPEYVPHVNLDDYAFELPAGRIAAVPLERRESSRLLVCTVASGRIDHLLFKDIPALLPTGAMLVLNDTRVVRARIVVPGKEGGRREIFLLEPVEPSHDPAIALAAVGETVWRCMLGGARKLARDGGVAIGNGLLQATVVGRSHETFLVRFEWDAPRSFAEILELVGQIPLPPYIHRETTERDAVTYQTVYADHEGSVAAPTAGLHFTPGILQSMEQSGVAIERVTLHVGAGTFKQVKGSDAAAHEMHQERISVDPAMLDRLIAHAQVRENEQGHPIVIAGTTSLRTIESLYWFGARVLLGDLPSDTAQIEVGQWDPYRLISQQGQSSLPSLPTSLAAVRAWSSARAGENIVGSTRIMIVPGYTFKACDALLTNFHQPGSTLILLVGALLGRNLWKRVYDEALDTGYRFLSYGDSSLLVLDADRMRG